MKTKIERIPVEKCVVRLCRFCAEPMHLWNYEWDTEYRWYVFQCSNCNFQVTMSESINQEFREIFQDDGVQYEPLTLEENELQSREWDDDYR